MSGVGIEKFVTWNPRMCLIILRDSSKYKKAKSVNKNVVSKISHKECIFYFHMFCWIMNRTQS